ncbi:hypothetical protein I545_3102 [Mycobacterium kansasii 662]|uniref:Uncharacterized protein n=2 Tax=Mycobacterium kansasii TaxID=1768 RepID=A0A1V3XJN4_MYCKA|nr:hypothetical protein I547_3352 [Mycobacterium kansasii 824]EUA17807.1 hypothetical protein I545_3102 [Mycobacterium kansasii 662]OOK78996.1 hypothetical protein BZL30_2850 [Mycobacterium kansasii]OOK80998.1 hypothetical protein BZL29_2786 [Mycobacterium kansasii]
MNRGGPVRAAKDVRVDHRVEGKHRHTISGALWGRRPLQQMQVTPDHPGAFSTGTHQTPWHLGNNPATRCSQT